MFDTPLLSCRARVTNTLSLQDIEDDVPRFVIGDAQQLGVIMGVLISNALRFTHKGEVVIMVSLTENFKSRSIIQGMRNH